MKTTIRVTKLRSAFNRLADYFLSQDHELEHLLREIKENEYDNKTDMIEHYKGSLLYDITVIQDGKREANKMMRENLENLFDSI